MKTNWQELNSTIEQNFTFDSFQDALKFVNKVGKLAEIQNHHPDILMHGYKNVKITLCTHEKGNKVTSKDYRLADRIDRL